MTTELIQLAFDYDQLDTETRIVVRQRTTEIRERLRRTAQDIVEVGQRMTEIKDRLPHGQFGPWLSAEFGMSEGHARKMMQVSRAFGQNDHYDRFAPTALMLLAAPGTPEEARAEALEAAAAGEPISTKMAEGIVAKHKPATIQPSRGVSKAARPPERREADELDAEPLSAYEQQVAAQAAPVAVEGDDDDAEDEVSPPALTPIRSAPAPTPAPAEVIAELPAVAPAPPPPPLLLLTPLQPAVEPAALVRTVALVALLSQALNLATVELAQLQHKLGPHAPIYSFPDATVEAAAKLFSASPAVKTAAGFLAMSAQEAAA
jgi:hypothetical protein